MLYYLNELSIIANIQLLYNSQEGFLSLCYVFIKYVICLSYERFFCDFLSVVEEGLRQFLPSTPKLFFLNCFYIWTLSYAYVYWVTQKLKYSCLIKCEMQNKEESFKY